MAPNTGNKALESSEEPIVPKIENIQKNVLTKRKTTIDIPASESFKVNGQSGNVRSPMISSYVGWKEIGGWEERDALTIDDELMLVNDETFFDNFIPDKFFGDWYHSVAILGVAGLLSFLIGYFKFSMAPMFYVATVASVLYRTSSKKYRSKLRDLVQKEFTVQKIESDYESMEWLNHTLSKLWPLIEPHVSKEIVMQVNQILLKEKSIPKFIKALWIDQFTLGVKPPRIDSVKTFPNTDRDIAVMDWTLSFTPHDHSDINAKKMKNYVNQYIVVKAKLFGLTIPVRVSDISFEVNTRLKFKLMEAFPHVETVNVQLLEVPDIDFIATLFGTSIFNWEILSLPGLHSFINQMAAKYMGPIVLPPFSFQLNLPKLLSKSPLSIGVLEIKIKNAEKLKLDASTLGTKNDSHNLYLQFKTQDKIIGKSKVISCTSNCTWNESIYVLLDSFTEPLAISLLEKREILKDKILGSLGYNLDSLNKKVGKEMNCSTTFLRSSKPVGNLNFTLRFHPTLEKKKLPDGTIEELPELNTGISKIVIERARGFNDDETNKQLSLYIELYVNGALVLTTKKKKSGDDSIFEWKNGFEFIVTNRRRAKAKFVIKDGKTNAEIGVLVENLNDLIDRQEIHKNWIPVNSDGAELKVTTHWRPVELGNNADSLIYNPPIGTVRVLINKANHLKHTKRIGPVDTYAKVMVNDVIRGKTIEKYQSSDPIWNEAIYVTVTSPNQKITIECMALEPLGPEISLGKFVLPTQNLFDKGIDGKYVEHIEEGHITSKLINSKGSSNGEIVYYLSFYPTVPVLSPEEIKDLERINKRKKLLEEDKKAKESNGMKLNRSDTDFFSKEENKIKDIESMFSNKMKLTLDELLSYNSGVFAFSILSGELPLPGLYVQVFLDSEPYARITSQRVSLRTIKTGLLADYMVKELEWSVTTLRVVTKPNSSRDDECVCEAIIPTIELIRNCYDNPSIVTLVGKRSAKVVIQASWFPINVTKLPQADLITNTGDLKISVIQGKDITDNTNGQCNPMVKVYLNDSTESVFKTKAVKKTTNPVWNETSEKILLSNRVNEYLKFKVFDSRVGKNSTVIDEGILPLSKINPESEENELTVPLKNNNGLLELNLKFEPRYAYKLDKPPTNVTDFSSKGINSGIKVGATVVGVGATGLGKIKTTLF
ncbi:hypothetical protein KAFR_0J00730 [Kazachstania africana CBS 2517]|uniref:Tricalbin n=1 Tax=Kazachstania africana (strain ATCC 22294 / BCRC 22015 / CBS 2517 / CECT 1963 / NBRC 1671 / NRRL Y-8276) TaxID=1071382 RepID=H2B0J1_KAZAF|nr:hypothetical protein KAFR_0J00730 [Kazachstania africana CBS 2517]CCF60141.1 hypothetical protein KAFR_0J00730 [Kazachstania africana CBS 2517]